MKKNLLYVVFCIIVIGDLTGELLQIKWMDYTFKPLIMIWVGGFFLAFSKNIDRDLIRMTVSAFLFSWLGDLFLMFSDTFLYFVLGLVSFLIAQLFYINLFLRTIKLSGKTSFLKKNPGWLIAYIIYGLGIYILLFPHLSDVLKPAVLIYMIALLGMSAMALNRRGNGHPLSFKLVFAGSSVFCFFRHM